MPKKVSQSGFGPVIVCHFALSSIWGPPKHPRITKNHQNFGEFHQNVGEFHLELNGFLHFWVDFWCHFTNSGVLFGGKIRWLEVVFVQ